MTATQDECPITSLPYTHTPVVTCYSPHFILAISLQSLHSNLEVPTCLLRSWGLERLNHSSRVTQLISEVMRIGPEIAPTQRPVCFTQLACFPVLANWSNVLPKERMAINQGRIVGSDTGLVYHVNLNQSLDFVFSLSGALSTPWLSPIPNWKLLNKRRAFCVFFFVPWSYVLYFLPSLYKKH
jgi:hypothetical protein